MASQGGRSSLDVKIDLLREGHTFSYFQVIRLLKLFAPVSKEGAPVSGQTDHVRVRPKLSLAFPPADVDRVEEDSDESPHFLVTATLLGLYGPSSPLPTFYTEDLMDEASADETVSRAFIDIINHRLFLLLFKSWAKYRPFLQVVEEKSSRDLNRLFSLVGLFDETTRKDVPDPYGLLRYVGLLTQFPRCALGLRNLLQDALGESPVQVLPCIPRKAKIPQDQRLSLGAANCALGIDSFLGEEIDDRMGKFRLQIGPLKAGQFQGLLPGGGSHEKLTFLTEFYVTDPLEYDVELVLSEGEAQSVCLGRPEWSRLGWDTWLFADKAMEEVKAIYCPERVAAG